MGILLDPISVMMLVVISTVSLMVHVYSPGLHEGRTWVSSVTTPFCRCLPMSMMGLVVATNIFQMYLFWELVGVSSYLLIGFYYTKKEADRRVEEGLYRDALRRSVIPRSESCFYRAITPGRSTP